MKVILSETRNVSTQFGNIEFTLERKNIKNINLRIRHDSLVYVSAPVYVPVNTIDNFVISKSAYICNAVNTFNANNVQKSDMQYISGENVTILGKNLRIKVEQDSREYVTSDGIYVYIHVKSPDCYNRRKNLFAKWMSEQCNEIFSGIMNEVHQRFIPYNVSLPQLKLRNMKSRWGSCQPYKGIITLNKRLIEAPKCCIEYVVYHEFCHFIHPNHSKQFYTLLQVMLPDWKENKILLEKKITIL